MSPFIITTKRADLVSAQVRNMQGGLVVSRRAVATLEEAREAVRLVLCAVPRGTDVQAVAEGYNARCGSMGPQGCTVGPLPDGTVIEVEPISWNALADAIGGPQLVWPASTEAAQRAQIDAYNVLA